MKTSLVSVIISTRDEGKNIERLLKSIVSQTYKNIEIIAVDNYSTDKTVSIAKKYTKHVYCFGPERSSQRNFGGVKAHGAYYLFLDADMQLPKTIISECVLAAKEKSTAAVIIPELTPVINFFSRCKNLEKLLYSNVVFIEAARFYKKSAFEKISGYNRDLIAGEDWDLSNRARAIGQINRIRTPLLHYETSMLQELKHKYYYASVIHKYAQLYPDEFKKQSGISRIKLFWKKRRILMSDPLAALGLLAVKNLEYLIYFWVGCVKKRSIHSML